MGKILVTLGGVVVIILFAALVAPYFINWNHYKNEIEARSAVFFGRPVHIDGQISVRLLPQPVLRIDGVRIDSAGKTRFFTAQAIEARLAVEPLLKSNIQITHIELVKPVLTLIRGGKGAGNWKPAAGKPPALANSDHVSVQNLHIQGGRIVYRDKIRDVEKSIEHINADLNAMSLRGPFKVSGTYGGGASSFKIATSRLGQAGDLRLTGRITGVFGDGRLSGQLQNMFDNAAFEGKLKFRREKNRDNRLFLSAEARVSLIDAVLKLQDITGTLGEGSAAMRYKGALSLIWEDAPRVSAEFSARRADLDRLLGTTGGQTPGSKKLMAFLMRVPASLPEGLGGVVDVKVAGGLIGGKSFSDLALKLASDGRNLSVDKLKVILPGQSGLEVAGVFEKQGQGPVFNGRFKIEMPDLRQFLNWTGYEGALMPGRGGLRFEMGSKVRLSPQNLELAGSTGKLGKSSFRGALAHQFEMDSWKLEATIDALDLDRYFRAGKGGSHSAPLSFSLVRPSRWAARFPALLSGKSDLSVNIGILTHGGKTYRGFAGDLRFNNGDLAIHQIAYNADQGERVDLSGNIANLRSKPKTYLKIKYLAPSMARAVPAAILRDLPELGTGLAALGAVDLDLRFTGLEDAKQARISLRGDGVMAGSKAQFEAGFSGVPENLNDGQINWRLRLENTSAKDLLDQLHIPETGTAWGGGAGSSFFEWSGKGAVNLLLPFSARLDLPGAKFSLKGTIEKDQKYRFSDVRLNLKVEDSAVLQGRLTGRSGKQAVQVPLTLSASLDGGQDNLVIAGASGAAGGAPYTGYGRIKLDGEKPEISLNLKPGRFELPLVLKILFGVDEDKSGDDGAPGFSSSLFDTARLHGFSLNLDVETPLMTLSKSLILKQAVLSLRTGAGVFDVQTLSGKLMGASMLASVRLEDDGNGILKGQSGLILEQLQLKNIFKGAGRREALSGVMSIKTDLEASGRSLSGLIATLGGSGEIHLTGAKVLIPDLFASSLIAGAAHRAGELEKAMKNSIGWRLTPYMSKSARAKISNGILVIENASFNADGGEGKFSVLADLSAQKLEAKWLFSLPNLKTAPPLGVIYSGPYTALEKRADYGALMRFITGKRIEREAEDSRKKATSSITAAPPAGLIRQNITDLPSLRGPAVR